MSQGIDADGIDDPELSLWEHQGHSLDLQELERALGAPDLRGLLAHWSIDPAALAVVVSVVRGDHVEDLEITDIGTAEVDGRLQLVITAASLAAEPADPSGPDRDGS